MKFFQPRPKRPSKRNSKLPAKISIGGLLLASLTLLGVQGMGKPHCSLKVNSVHYSTYMNEYRNIDAIKVNIRSTCNVMQKYTFITPEILEVRAKNYVVQHNFGHRTAKALKYQPTDALFEDLYIDCTKGKVTRYIGRAIGIVKLTDGGNYPVSARSENSFVVNCKI